MPLRLTITYAFQLLIILFLPFRLLSQKNVTITASPNQGCAPLIVNFTATSSDSYLWDLGNGNPSSNATPTATYVNPGTYNVSLTVEQNGQSYSATCSITVFPNPSPNFAVLDGTNSGCQPLTTNFTDLSSPASAPLVHWHWDFGDGAAETSTSSTNPTHEYTLAYDFTVTLEVTDDNGCSDIKVRNQYVHVSPLPVVAIDADTQKFCIAPGTVHFQSLANSAAGIATHFWDFGDGTTSTDPNPVHTYNNFQHYDVTLAVTDQNTCPNDNVFPDFIQIDTVRAHFEMPDTVCAGDTIFVTNNSVAANQYNWNYAGQNSPETEPEFVISFGGNFAVTLSASLYGNCTDTEVHSIFVESVFANMGPNPWYVCSIPTDVNLVDSSVTNNSNGFASWMWTVTPPDSLHNEMTFWSDTAYTQNVVWTAVIGETPGINFYDFEVYQVVLEVTTPFGCKDTAYDSIQTYIPTVDYMPNPIGGCVPQNITFSNNSSYSSPYDNFVSLSWDFANGNTYLGTNPPAQLYNTPGYYQTSLTGTTQMGCVHIDTYPIQIGTETFPDIQMLSNDTICASEQAIFVNLSEPDSVITSYEVHTNYGNYHEIINDTLYINPVDTGWFDIQFVSVHNMCYSDTSYDNMFYVEGPIGFVQSIFECPNIYHFSPDSDIVDGIYAATSFEWHFGDSIIDSINQVVDHAYLQNIDTWAYLYTYNENTGCSYADSSSVRDDIAMAAFTPDTPVACVGTPIVFDPAGSINPNLFAIGASAAYHKWNFGDNAVFYEPDFSLSDTGSYGMLDYAYNAPGEYEVVMKVFDLNSCVDSAVHSVRIFQPQPDPLITPPSGCSPLSCSFADATYADTFLTAWQWVFGQGDTSYQQHPSGTIQFLNDSIYEGYLQITDTLGCVGTTNFEIVSSEPSPKFGAIDKMVCIGDTIFFENLSEYISPTPEFVWSFGDGTSSIEEEPWHLYQAEGIYDVTLQITDGACVKDTVINNFSVIQDPTVEIELVYDGQVCAPVIVNQMIANELKIYHTPIWNFGDGMISNEDTPTHTYIESGVYDIYVMIATHACPLYYSDTIKLEVYNVQANLDVSKDTLCLGDAVYFTVENQIDVETFTIDFGDGETSVDAVQVVHNYHITSEENNLTAYLTAWNGPCFSIDEQVLQILDVRANFFRGINDEVTEGCVPLSVPFIDKSLNAEAIHWVFDDGNESYQASPNHTFTTPGEYTVTQFVTNSVYNCNVNHKAPITVFPLPDINVDLYHEICYGDEVQLNAANNPSYVYTWNPANEVSDPYIPNPVAYPSETMDFGIHVKDTNDCENSETVHVFVQTDPYLSFPDTVSIIVGDVFYFNDDPLFNVEYIWTPPYNLSCPNCYEAGFQPIYDTTYYVTMLAMAGNDTCYVNHDSLHIDVDWKFTVDVPSVFTPNGDGNNDVVFADGWGIKKLLEFKIYNRWGELVFSTDDITIGWDGRYKGQPQVIDTYVYTVRVITWEEKTLEAKGTITLMR